MTRISTIYCGKTSKTHFLVSEKHRKRDFDDFDKYMGENQEKKVRNSLFFHISAGAFIVENCTFLRKSALFYPVSEDPFSVFQYRGKNQENDPPKNSKKIHVFSTFVSKRSKNPRNLPHNYKEIP